MSVRQGLGGPPSAALISVALALVLQACSGTAEEPPRLPLNGPVGRVLVVGDSLAFQIAQGLGRVQRGHHLRVSNGGVPGCGLIRGGEQLRDSVWTSGSSFCEGWPQRWRSLVRSKEPEVVVLMTGFWDAFDRRLAESRVLEFGSNEADDYMKREINAVLDVLTAGGARILLLTTPYFAPPEDEESPSARDEGRVDHLNDIFRETAEERDDVDVRDLKKLLTPNGYRTDIDGVDMRGDGIHLTPAGQRYVAGWLAPQLVRAIVESRHSL